MILYSKSNWKKLWSKLNPSSNQISIHEVSLVMSNYYSLKSCLSHSSNTVKNIGNSTVDHPFWSWGRWFERVSPVLAFVQNSFRLLWGFVWGISYFELLVVIVDTMQLQIFLSPISNYVTTGDERMMHKMHWLTLWKRRISFYYSYVTCMQFTDFKWLRSISILS